VYATTRSTNASYLTAWSSGTGAAGVVGYFWKVAGTEWWHASVASTLLAAAVVLPISYALVYYTSLWNIDDDNHDDSDDDDDEEEHSAVVNRNDEVGDNENTGLFNRNETRSLLVRRKQLREALLEMERVPLIRDERRRGEMDTSTQMVDLSLNRDTAAGAPSTFAARCAFFWQLWPYTIPLFLVYAAEYACQAGAWTAMGFPIQDTQQRNKFYQTSNWLYQAGVLVSRSSGTLLTLSSTVLWLMPALQVVNLVVFTMIAAQTPETLPWLYNPSVLYAISVWTGLLGGAVYVHGYKRIVLDFAGSPHTELALASTSLAESVGIIVADVVGLFLQGCLYQVHQLPGAVVECPI